MGFFDALLGRTKPVKPNLDALFALPNAAVTLQVAAGLAPTGVGSVCFKGAEGGAFAQTQAELTSLLAADQASRVEQTTDTYGFTWLVCRHGADDVAGLVTDLHAVNSTLADAGFGGSLLCSVVCFERSAAVGRFGLVYLYKRGTFYPFAPQDGQRRDSAFELQVRSYLGADVPVEADLTRWFPVWGAPGL